MKNKEEQRTEAIEYSILLWEWLVKTGKKDKTQWPDWDFNGGTFQPQRLQCFLCDFTTKEGGLPDRKCEPCPYYQKYQAKCFAQASPFQIWRDCEDVEERKKYAKEFLQRLQALLPARKFKIGDRVRITIGDKGDSRFYLHHKDDIGEIVGYADGLWRVRFSHLYGDLGKDCYYGDNDLELAVVATPSKTITQEAKAKFEVGDKVKITATGWKGKEGVIVKVAERGEWLAVKAPDEALDGYFSERELELLGRKVYRVYIAGALSTLPAYLDDQRTPSKVVVDYIANCAKMCQVAAEVRKLGFAPYVPAMDFMMGFANGEFSEEDYRGTGMAFLEVCDVVLAISESQGVDKELARANELGIPWVSSIAGLQAWAQRRAK